MTDEKFVRLMICFLAAFLFLHLIIYYGYTGETLELSEKLLKKSATTGRHEPSKQVEVTAFGDLVRLSYLYRLGSRQTVTATSDSLGYLNPDYRPGKDYPVVTVGDSFLMVSSDENRFNALLGQKLGVPCYNMAANGVEDPFAFLQSDFVRRTKVLVWECVERNIQAEHFNINKMEYYHALAAKKAACVETWTKDSLRPHEFKQVNSANIKFIVNNLYFSLKGVPLLGEAGVARLKDGRKLLYFKDDLIYFQRPYFEEDLARAVEFICRINRELQKYGVRLVFLAIPDKYNAYYELIADETKPAAENRFIRCLVDELRQNGVPAANLLDPYRELIDRGIDPYPPDDTHWNNTGTDLAAELTADLITEHDLLKQ